MVYTSPARAFEAFKGFGHFPAPPGRAPRDPACTLGRVPRLCGSCPRHPFGAGNMPCSLDLSTARPCLQVAVLRPDLALHAGPAGRLVAMLRDQAQPNGSATNICVDAFLRLCWGDSDSSEMNVQRRHINLSSARTPTETLSTQKPCADAFTGVRRCESLAAAGHWRFPSAALREGR